MRLSSGCSDIAEVKAILSIFAFSAVVMEEVIGFVEIKFDIERVRFSGGGGEAGILFAKLSLILDIYQLAKWPTY